MEMFVKYLAIVQVSSLSPAPRLLVAGLGRADVVQVEVGAQLHNFALKFDQERSKDNSVLHFIRKDDRIIQFSPGPAWQLLVCCRSVCSCRGAHALGEG